MNTTRTENRAQFGPLFDAFSSLIEVATESLRTCVNAYRIEKDIKHVRKLSDYELDDIGILREDIEKVLRTGRKQR